jgi:hypothetical protein
MYCIDIELLFYNIYSHLDVDSDVIQVYFYNR